MSSTQELMAALVILAELNEYSDIKLIGKLNWKTVPESYKKTKTTIVGTHKIIEYVQNDTFVVDIYGLGLYQIM